ncbi:hypothetical protein ACQCRE_24655, partial [Ralstonia pseudosolanacearum]|uniref:hypothetical protein n=2 Tax=Ralstonia pseudosolanacearum TaxID=1310165 RepID=UPI003CE80AA7
VAAGAVGSVGGGSGAFMGSNVDRYNRQLHPDEKALIHAKANGDKAAEKRLTDAACYRVQCWAEYSPNSQEYLARYVSDTDAKDLGRELKWVDSQKVSGGKFDYTPMQRVGDFIAGQTDQAKRAAQGFVEEVKNLPRAFVNKMASDAKQKMSESPSDLIAQGVANGLSAVAGAGRGEPPAASPGAVLANPAARQAASASLSVTADTPPNAIASTSGGDGNSSGSNIQQNKAKGDAFENSVAKSYQDQYPEVGQQVTIRTGDGTRTRLDILARDQDGKIICAECKSSDTAPLTRNQKSGFPQIEETGGVIVGKGKPGFEGGTVIPPTKVDIVRPPSGSGAK